MINGIYTLANDVVYEQLVALLNSIETNAGKNFPVCIIPYNENLDKVKAEIVTRENVTLFENSESINYWDNYAIQVWKNYPRAQKIWRKLGFSDLYELPAHRKLCAFDGDFNKFIYFDADTLLMSPLDYVYEKLEKYDWITNDFQYKSDIKFIFDASPELIKQIFGIEEVQSHLFCSGWFAAKKHIFSPGTLANLQEKLQAGESDVLSFICPDQALFNYMVLRSGVSYYNFGYDHENQSTGNHWSSNFDVIDNILYDKGTRITYVHFMSIGSSPFNKLCAGEDVNIPYRDVFLHYRYLKSPEQKPQTFKRPSLITQLHKNITGFINQKISNFKLNYRNFQDRISRN